MAGRAGRRGIDTEGHVIHCANLYGDNLDQSYIDGLVRGRAQTLESKFSLSYNLVLNMLSGEVITPDCDYRIPVTQQTMLRTDVDRELAQVEGEIKEIETKLGSMCCCCGTPKEILEQYHAALTLKTGNNKARKKAKRDAASMKDQHHKLDADYTRYLERLALTEELKVRNEERLNVKEYFESQTKGYVQLLKSEGFVEEVGGRFELTETGVIASKIQEGPGHIIGRLASDTQFFKEFSDAELCAVLSSFAGGHTNDRMPGELPERVEGCLARAVELEDRFGDLERGVNLSSTSSEHAVCTAVAPAVYRWALASDATDCLDVRAAVAEGGLFLGEFIKVLLKVVTLVEELQRIADNTGQTALLEKLTRARGLLMKDVASSASLYL
jgi:superfamily II RNA helicase